MRNHLILGAVGAIFLTASALAISPPRQAPPREDTQPGLGALAPFVNVKAAPYFCAGDGVADDTACIQAAITAAALGAGNELFFPPGTYLVTNLTHGATPWRGVPRQSIIKAKSGGDTGYMVASGQWLAASQATASAPWDYVTGVDFDCNGLKTYCVVLRTYFTKFENTQIKGSTDTDLLMSADGRDATALSSTMVNNVFIDNWFGVDGVTAAYNFRTIDSGCKGLDARLTNNYFSGATVANFWLVCSAGWDIFGNHTYTAPTGAYIYKPNIGTRIVENYFENPVRIGSPNGAATYAAYLGGGNYFADTVWADFDNVGNFIISHDNEYGVSAELRHAYFDPSKVVVSIGDTFRSATPFKHYASAGGAAQDASTGKFLVNGSMLTPIGRLVSIKFDGSASAASGIIHRPASFDLDKYDAVTTSGVGMVPTYGITPVLLTAQTANLAATNVYAAAPAGEYRVCADARTTTSGTGTTANLNIIWTDEGGVKTDAVGTWALNSVTVTGQINKCEYIHAAAATNIQVSVTAGTYGTSVYAISATAERLN